MTTPAGTTLQRHLSTRQKILIGVVWGGMVCGIVAVAWFAPQADGSSLFSLTAIIGAIIAFTLTFRIALRPAGTPYIQITAVEGLRGEFSITRQWPVLIGIWVGMIALVCILGILEEPRGAPVIYGWALTGLIALFFYGFLLVRALDRVIFFRVDDDGAIFIKRARGDWIPLRLTDYRRIVLRTMSGRHASAAPSQLDFLEPVAGVAALSIPILYVKSRRYGTMAYSTIIEEFFREACKRAGHRVMMKGGGWEAVKIMEIKLIS